MQDLYKPDSNRLRRNLSGIINFAKFREEKLVPYTDMQECVEHLLEDTADLEELNLKLVCSCSCTSMLHGVMQSQQHPSTELAVLCCHDFFVCAMTDQDMPGLWIHPVPGLGVLMSHHTNMLCRLLTWPSWKLREQLRNR